MSDARPSGSPAGLLLVVLGLWVLGQTIVGGLVGRLLALSGSSGSSSSSPSIPGTPIAPDSVAQQVLGASGGGGPTSATAAAGPSGSANPAPGVPIQGGLLPVLQQVAGS